MIECNENEKIVVDGVTYYKPTEPVKKQTGWEEPEEGKHYYSLATYNSERITHVLAYMPTAHSLDSSRLENASVFTDEDFAKQYARHETLWRRIAKWQAENDKPLNLKDMEEMKHYIVFDYSSKTIGHVGFRWSYLTNSVLFSSEKKCEECIEVFRAELEWDMNEFKWRLDGE